MLKPVTLYMLEIFNIPLMIVRLDHFVIIFTYKKFNLLDLVCRKGIWLKLKNSCKFFYPCVVYQRVVVMGWLLHGFTDWIIFSYFL